MEGRGEPTDSLLLPCSRCPYTLCACQHLCVPMDLAYHRTTGERRSPRSVPRQVNAVCNESKLSVKIAKAYLDKLMALKLGDETMSQLMRGLRARRTALELLSKLANFIHELAEDGAIQEGQVDALLHELEHDAVHLRGNKAPTLDGTAGGSQGALPMSEVVQFVLELNKLREATLTELIEKGYAASVSKRFSFEKVPLEVHAPTNLCTHELA